MSPFSHIGGLLLRQAAGVAWEWPREQMPWPWFPRPWQVHDAEEVVGRWWAAAPRPLKHGQERRVRGPRGRRGRLSGWPATESWPLGCLAWTVLGAQDAPKSRSQGSQAPQTARPRWLCKTPDVCGTWRRWPNRNAAPDALGHRGPMDRQVTVVSVFSYWDCPLKQIAVPRGPKRVETHYKPRRFLAQRFPLPRHNTEADFIVGDSAESVLAAGNCECPSKVWSWPNTVMAASLRTLAAIERSVRTKELERRKKGKKRKRINKELLPVFSEPRPTNPDPVRVVVAQGSSIVLIFFLPTTFYTGRGLTSRLSLPSTRQLMHHSIVLRLGRSRHLREA